MQYLLSIWRARRGPAMDTWHSQRELAVLYLRFYGALLGSIFVTYQSQRSVSRTCPLSITVGSCFSESQVVVHHNMPMLLLPEVCLGCWPSLMGVRLNSARVCATRLVIAEPMLPQIFSNCMHSSVAQTAYGVCFTTDVLCGYVVLLAGDSAQ